MKLVKIYHTPAALDYMPLYAEIMRAPSVLIAGVPGSGKSVLLNGLIYNTLAEYAPGAATMYFFDLKQVELYKYSKLPQCAGYAETPEHAVTLLRELITIMNMRYKEMKRREIVKTDEKPIFVFIDEMARIMLTDRAKEFTNLLQDLLQLGRAAGIHCVCCTQIPNRKVIPGNLQALYNMKIALRCVSAIESRQIINTPGAEKLPQYGNAILLDSNGYRKIDNLPMITDNAIKTRIEFWKNQRGKLKIVW